MCSLVIFDEILSHVNISAYVIFQQCIGTNCTTRDEDRYYYKGTRFQCHQSNDPKDQAAHNKLCYQCASIRESGEKCSLHKQIDFANYTDKKIEPALKLKKETSP